MSDSPTSKVLGGLLIAVGVLIAVTSGGCSLFFAAQSVASGSASALVSWFLIIAVVGGVPFLCGVALIVGGRTLMKPTAAQPSPRPAAGEDPPAAHRPDR